MLQLLRDESNPDPERQDTDSRIWNRIKILRIRETKNKLPRLTAGAKNYHNYVLEKMLPNEVYV